MIAIPPQFFTADFGAGLLVLIGGVVIVSAIGFAAQGLSRSEADEDRQRRLVDLYLYAEHLKRQSKGGAQQ